MDIFIEKKKLADSFLAYAVIVKKKVNENYLV